MEQPQPPPLSAESVGPVAVEGRAPAALAPIAEPGVTQVSLRWSGVGALHQGYFSDSEALAGLGAALGVHLGRRSLDLQVGWNSEDSVGTIRLFLDESDLPGVLEGGGDASALLPIMKSLAAYRDTVAGRYDIRVLSFQIRIAVGETCELEAVGDYPPDGSEVSACVAGRSK